MEKSEEAEAVTSLGPEIDLLSAIWWVTMGCISLRMPMMME